MTIRRIDQDGPFAQAVVAGGIVYIAGQVADDASSPIDEQTLQVLQKIDKLLADAGTDKSALLSVNVYLTDIDDFAAMNTVWANWVPDGSKPVRATVESRLALPGLKVEMQAVAALVRENGTHGTL